MTLLDLVAQAGRDLRQAGIATTEAALDAELLARHLLGWDRATWLLRRPEPAAADFESEYSALIRRRRAREPLAYIRGVQEFWGREFLVTPAVLIPRPETELLIERALESIPVARGARVIDIGTGSGCIAITIALERPQADVIATDISEDALAVARQNAARLGASNVTFATGPYFADSHGAFAVVVSNPPYVPERDRAILSPEVLSEPHLALFASSEGLSEVREILHRSPDRLQPAGRVIVEIGFGQERGVAAAVAATPNLRLLHVSHDLQGIPRVVVAERV